MLARALLLLPLLASICFAAKSQDPARRAIKKRIDRILKDLNTVRTSSKLEKVGTQLLDFYEGGDLIEEDRETLKSRAVPILKKLKQDALKPLWTIHSSGSWKNLVSQKKKLENLRSKALTLIFNKKIYLPEDVRGWKAERVNWNGQVKVDARVSEVRKVWNDSQRMTRGSSQQDKVSMVRDINKIYLDSFDEEPDRSELEGMDLLLLNLGSKSPLTIRSIVLSKEEKEQIAHNRRVEKYNRILQHRDVDARTKEHVTVFNDYREMMGRNRLFIDARLCRACKKHSKVCDKAGKIWHDGKDGTPSSRAAKEGFKLAVGENVARGAYGKASEYWTRGWYRASDHHRNGLMEHYTCIGFGQAGITATQNFAAAPNPKGL